MIFEFSVRRTNINYISYSFSFFFYELNNLFCLVVFSVFNLNKEIFVVQEKYLYKKHFSFLSSFFY